MRFSPTTAPSSSPTLAAWSRRSSAVAARALVSRSPTVDRCGTSGVGFVGTRRDAGAVRAPFLVALEGVIQVIISVLKRLVSRMRK